MLVDEKDKVIFEQNCQDFRSMNEIMWRVPIIVITLTGGLWFGVSSIDISDEAKKYLLWLAGAANVVFIVVLIRLRYVMNGILRDIKSFQGKQPGLGFIFVGFFSVLLLFSAVVSFYAASEGSAFYAKKKDDNSNGTGATDKAVPGGTENGRTKGE